MIPFIFTGFHAYQSKIIAFSNILPEDTRQFIKLLPRKFCNILGKKKTGKNRRICMSYSGTEPKLRLLVEAEKEKLPEDVMNVFQKSIENYQQFLE
jgi:phosphomannomutase